MTDSNDNIVKILILGDCQVGKTKILLEYIKYNNNMDLNNNNYKLNESINNDDPYVPTSIEVYKSEFKINDKDYILSIADISGNRHDELYVQMRNYFYLIEKKIDVILLCFSLVDLYSYHNVTKKWLPEIKKYYANTPVLLVGTKCDLKQKVKESKINAATKLDNSMQASIISENKFSIDSKKISSELFSLTTSLHNQLSKTKSPSTELKRPLSLISKMSKEEFFQSSHNLDRIDENFMNLLNKLNSIPPYLTLNEFVKLSLLDEEAKNNKTFGDSESASLSFQYVNKKSINKLKESVNTKYYFKTSYSDLDSIRFLMEKAIVTGINFHLKRSKIMVKSSRSNLNMSQESDFMLRGEEEAKINALEKSVTKSVSKGKKSEKRRGLSRCFSCTRSETNTSLNQI